MIEKSTKERPAEQTCSAGHRYILLKQFQFQTALGIVGIQGQAAVEEFFGLSRISVVQHTIGMVHFSTTAVTGLYIVLAHPF